MEHILVFKLDHQQFGLDLFVVERIIWALEVTPLPHAPANILGMMNFYGKIIPVINMRQFFGLKEKELELEDQFIICHTQAKSLALWVDHVKGVVNSAQEESIISQNILPNMNKIDSVIKHEDQLISIFNIDKILFSIEKPSQINVGQ